MNKRSEIAAIESTITDPSYYKNAGGLRFHCLLNGEHFYINLSRDEVPNFLKKHDFIDEVSEGKMYVRQNASFINKHRAIVWFDKLVEVTYESLEFTKCQIVTFCAIAEWERCYGIMGKVVSMFNLLRPTA